MVAPKMMLASGSAASATTRAASLTSTSDRSGPPVTPSRMPRAPSMGVSRSGEAIAAWAASVARLPPPAYPMPSSAVPAPRMMVRTSAKSRLIRPGSVIRSQMPCTPWRSRSSQTLKASTMLVPRSSTAIRRSLGMMITVSADPCRASSPTAAASVRRLPSKPKGRVTTATVSAPISRAIFATSGAPPVPVPPPSPAAMNTRSLPRSARRTCSSLSRTACSPRWGSPPVPRPRVISIPTGMRTSASLTSSAWRSVLTATNSTPRRPASIMRSTALQPAPPTPTTRMTAT